MTQILNFCIKTGFNLTLDRDDEHTNTHGEVMVNIKGIWGSICMDGWSRREASVVCRSQGFSGGVPYQVPSNSKYKRPILMSNVQCSGSETSLSQCTYSGWYQDSPCTYKDNRAGVLCFTQESKSRGTSLGEPAIHKPSLISGGFSFELYM